MTEQISPSTLRPTLRMLSDEQIRAIHNTSLDILSGTGISLKHDGARTLLLDHGAWETDGRVKIPEHLVMEAIRTAPSRIPMHNRLGRLTMPLEEGKVFFGTGSDCPFTIDAESASGAPPSPRMSAASLGSPTRWTRSTSSCRWAPPRTSPRWTTTSIASSA